MIPFRPDNSLGRALLLVYEKERQREASQSKTGLGLLPHGQAAEQRGESLPNEGVVCVVG